jgi:hypothetical protein
MLITKDNVAKIAERIVANELEARGFKQGWGPRPLLRQLSVVAIPARLGVNLRHGSMILFEKTRGIELRVMPPLE